MTDFRREDISNQKAYDLLRDWIKLVARHTNPDQDISELLGWLWKLKPATPDPITGLDTDTNVARSDHAKVHANEMQEGRHSA